PRRVPGPSRSFPGGAGEARRPRRSRRVVQVGDDPHRPYRRAGIRILSLPPVRRLRDLRGHQEPTMPFVESLGEFITPHGGNPVKHPAGFMILPSGATYHPNDIGGEIRYEPPGTEGSMMRLHARCQYRWAKVVVAEATFKRLKDAADGKAGVDGFGQSIAFEW